MIELNGIYKLKYIKGLTLVNQDTSDYKVLSISKDNYFVVCEKINGCEAGERFRFIKECLIDPEKPDDIYFSEIIKKK